MNEKTVKPWSVDFPKLQWLVCGLMLCACGGGGGNTAGSPGLAPIAAPTTQEQQCQNAGWTREAVTLAGLQRKVLWKAPSAWARGAMVIMHGGGGSHTNFCVANVDSIAAQVRFTDIALAQGFAVFLIDSTDSVSDNDGRICGKVWDDEVRSRANLDLPFIEDVLNGSFLPNGRRVAAAKSLWPGTHLAATWQCVPLVTFRNSSPPLFRSQAEILMAGSAIARGALEIASMSLEPVTTMKPGAKLSSRAPARQAAIQMKRHGMVHRMQPSQHFACFIMRKTVLTIAPVWPKSAHSCWHVDTRKSRRICLTEVLAVPMRICGLTNTALHCSRFSHRAYVDSIGQASENRAHRYLAIANQRYSNL